MKKYYLVLFFVIALQSVTYAQDPFIGEVRLFGGNFAPRDWAFCEGQLLPISNYNALFSIIGTTYGGDGRTTFALPDLRGRVPVHPGTGPGLTEVRLGQNAGSESTTLNANQIPGHTHQAYGVSETGTVSSPQGSYPAYTMPLDPEYAQSGTTVPMNSGVIGTNQTTSESVENRQPSLGVRYIICLYGTYPSRS